jgi:capsular exopolysaccharide synthesis family protein
VENTLEPSAAIQIVRKRWISILTCTILGLALAFAYIATTRKQYQASVQLFVSAQDGRNSIADANQGSQFTASRVASYARVADSPRVTEPVIRQLGLHTTSSDLAKQIRATSPPDTVLIDLSVTDTSAAQAARIANAAAAEFSTLVSELERPADAKGVPVKLSVVKPAAVPRAPVTPRTALDLTLGLLVGLLAGTLAAGLREALDTAVRRPQQLRDMGLAVLGAIPFDAAAASRPLIADESPHSPRSEAFRQLRTNLQFLDVERPQRSVVITSALANEGKSTTAINLAVTLVRGGKRVALVEGDLRRPRVTRYLGLADESPGTSDVLIGRTELNDALLEYHDEGLLVLPSGAVPPNPSELLGSSAMRSLVEELQARCDLVLIDAPPLLPVTDAALLSAISDGVILVVRAGKTSHEHVSRAVHALGAVDAHVLGTVLTMVKTRGPDASAYRYGYGYRDSSRRRQPTEPLSAARSVGAGDEATRNPSSV